MLTKSRAELMMMRNLMNVSLVIVLAGTCQATDGPHGGPGLGLDKLKWGMTTAEMRAIYPVLRDSDGHALRIANYLYAGCKFDVFPEFSNDRFDTVILETQEPAPCYLQIRKELMAQYGTPDPEESFGNGRRLGWKSSSTLVWDIGDAKFLHIAFEQTSGSPHHVIYDWASRGGYRTPAKP